MHAERFLPFALAVLTVLAGCVAAPADPPPAAGSAGVTPDLAADGATRAFADGALVLEWEGTVGFGAAPHATGPLVPVNDVVAHEFEVDASVRLVALELESPDGLVLASRLENETRRLACGATTRDASGCTALVPLDQPLVTYRVRLTRADDPPDPAPDARYVLRVALRPPGHVPAPVVADVSDAALRVRVADTGHRGGEPTLGILSDGTVFVAQGGGVDPPLLRSRDDGRSWERVAPPVNPGSFDPMLAVDPWSDRVYVNHLAVSGTVHSWSDDLGESWVTNPVAAAGGGAMDAQTLAVGDASGPLAPAGHALYLAWKDLAGAATESEPLARLVVSRSTDGGLAWTSTTVATAREHGVVGGGAVAADRAGNVYLPTWTVDRDVAMVVSDDRGETWRIVPVAERDGSPDTRLSAAVDEAGNVYSTHASGGAVRLSRSSDAGAMWASPVVVSPPALRSVVFADVAAGDEGRVAVAYLASADTDKGPDLADAWARWHVYVSVTLDALAPEPGWRTARVTPLDDPVQIGPVCTGGAACDTDARNMLDFIDVKAGPDGRLYVAYTDGCGPGCSTPQESRGERGHVAVLEEGPRLYADRAPWARA